MRYAVRDLKILLILFVCFFCGFSAGVSDRACAEDSVGVTAIQPAPVSEMKIFDTKFAKSERVDGVGGERCLRVDVFKQGEKNWSVLHHTGTNTTPIKKGDIIVTVLRMRVTGERTEIGDVGVYAEGVEARKGGSVGGRFQPGTGLRTYRRSVEAPYDYAPGQFRLSIHLAAKPQVIEMYAASMEVFPAGTPREILKTDGITWPGREADAPWRKTANVRIDQLRKANLEIRVVDVDNDPIEGAEVTIQQQQHAWRFGTFVGGKMLEDSEDGRRYRDAVLQRFNFVTLPAYLANWGWRNDNNRKNYFRLADWAADHDIPARGHLLVYPGWTATPAEWFEIPKPELRKKMAAHIPRATRAFLDRGVSEWDVTNELRFNEKFIEEIGGMEVAADWFKQARKHNPDGDLYLNETFVISNGGSTETEQSTMERHFKTLIDLGAPIDGIGLQGHFASEMTPPVRAIEILDRMSKLTGKIMITEFDMDNDDKQAQADYIRDFYTACFSHPAVEGIVRWGFWEGDMWKPRGHAIKKDWMPTVQATAYEDLVYKQWWTDESGVTSNDGSFKARAFKGKQQVTVKHNGYQWTKIIDLTDDQSLAITVP